MQIVIHDFESKNEMHEKRRKYARLIALGEESESPRIFRIYETPSGAISVVGSGLQRDITVKQIESTDSVVFGFDCALYFIDKKLFKEVSRVKLHGVFFEFLSGASSLSLIALHELGLASVDYKGNVIWEYFAKDIIEGGKTEGDRIQLLLHGGIKVEVNASSGFAQIVST